MDAPEGKTTHFDRDRAVIGGGWLAVLTGVELAVWNVYQMHADENGVAWPGLARIARLVGHQNTRAVMRARKRLIAMGLLEIIDPGGGRAPSTLRVTTPPPVQNDHGVKSGTDRNGRRRGGQSGHGSRGQNDHVTRGQNGHPNNSGNDSKGTPQHNNPAAGGGGGRVFSEWMGAKNEAKYVSLHGIEHCLRVAKLVNALTEEGRCEQPKRMLKHLLDQEPEDVDFEPLHNHEEAERVNAMLAADRDRRQREEAEKNRQVADAKAVLKNTPTEDKDAWRELCILKLGAMPQDDAEIIAAAELIRKTPDVRAALANARRLHR